MNYSRNERNILAPVLGVGLALAGISYSGLSSWNAKRLERNRESLVFEEAVNGFHSDIASEIIYAFKRSGKYGSKEIHQMEERVREITEDGLYKKIKLAEFREGIDLAENYLRVYPESEHRREVVRDLVMHRSSSLFDSFMGDRPYNEIISNLTSLNSELKVYKSEIDLAEIPIRELVEAGRDYFLACKDNPSGKVDIGTIVKFIKPEEDTRGWWNSTYYSERNNAIPYGSRGKIVFLGNESGSAYEVHFPQIDKISWSQDWRFLDRPSLRTYYPDRGMNVATFYGQELHIFPSLNIAQLEQFDMELNNLESFRTENVALK